MTDEAQTTEPTVTKTGNVVPTNYRKEYKRLGGNNGDWVAQVLKAYKTEERVYDLLDANGKSDKRWPGKNFGMVRMNAGNVLRGVVAKTGKLTLTNGETLTFADVNAE